MPGPPGHDDGARVAGRDVLHAGADERRARAEQRHRLALHVRPHQRAVRVVVLEERDERRRDRHELLGRHVDELHVVARRQDEVALLARVHPLLHEAQVGVELHVRLRDDVLVLLPRREVEGVRLPLGRLLAACALAWAFSSSASRSSTISPALNLVPPPFWIRT